MGILDWLIAFVPFLSFGLLPVIGTLIGGKPVQQSMGVALGAFIFATIVYLIRLPELTPHIFLISFLSGVFWAVGSVGQFVGIKYLGVSRASPILNGGQIVTTSLVGIMLGDWATSSAKTYGFIALALIIIGIILTSYKQEQGKDKIRWGKGILVNLISVFGYTAYVGILKYYQIDGWSSIFPQSLGQVTAVFLISLLIFKVQPLGRFSLRNSVVGLIWALGNITLLLSQASLGLAISYPISQASVVVAVLGGVFINKESKNRKEWIYTSIGITVISCGLFFIYLSGLS